METHTQRELGMSVGGSGGPDIRCQTSGRRRLPGVLGPAPSPQARWEAPVRQSLGKAPGRRGSQEPPGRILHAGDRKLSLMNEFFYVSLY